MSEVYVVKLDQETLTAMFTEGNSFPQHRVEHGLPKDCKLVDVKIEADGEISFYFVPSNVVIKEITPQYKKEAIVMKDVFRRS